MDPEPLFRSADNLHKVRFTPSSSSHSRRAEPPPEAGPSKPLAFRMSNSPSSNSPVKTAIQRFHVGENNADPSILLPNINGTTPIKDRGKAMIHTSPGRSSDTTLSHKAKGKQRAVDLTDANSDHSEHEASGELRVRGKEQELKQAIRQQLENETRRERQQTEEPQDFDPHAAEREKERDKERIRQLEEEIRLLREEVGLVVST